MNENFGEISQILSKHKLEFIENPNSLTCASCTKVFVNAYQTPSGCHFCCKCVGEYLAKENTNSPSKSVKSQLNIPSCFSTDNLINKRKSVLFEKCPIEKCTYECSMDDMEEHLQNCSKKYFKCPFAELGCIHGKIERDKLGDHFQDETINHYKLMIEMIIQLKNEVLELKQNELLMKSELNVLKENEKKSTKENDILEDTNSEAEQNVRNYIEMHKVSVDSSREILSSERQSESESYREEGLLSRSLVASDVFNSQQEAYEDLFKRQIEEKFIEMKQKWNRKLDLITNKKIQKSTEELMTKLNDLNKRINMKDNIFEWNINKIIQITKNENITSDFFYNRMNPYKLRLKLKVCINFLWIRLRVYSGLSDPLLKWPFHADVTIKISNVNSPDACRIFVQNCKINKPIISSYKSSDRFTFLFSDLSAVGLLNDCNCIIECFVNFE